MALEDCLDLDSLNSLDLNADDVFICRAALDDETAANLALRCRLETIGTADAHPINADNKIKICVHPRPSAVIKGSNGYSTNRLINFIGSWPSELPDRNE